VSSSFEVELASTKKMDQTIFIVC